MNALLIVATMGHLSVACCPVCGMIIGGMIIGGMWYVVTTIAYYIQVGARVDQF